MADPPTVLVLTTYDLDGYVFDVLAAGASGSPPARTRAGDAP